MGVAGHVAQPLTHHGHHVIGDIRLHRGVDGVNELVLGLARCLGQPATVHAQEQGRGVAQRGAGQRGLTAQAFHEADVLVPVT